jgi:hypothetical protein
MGNRYNNLKCMRCGRDESIKNSPIMDEVNLPCPNNCGAEHEYLKCPGCGYLFAIPAMCNPMPLPPEFLDDEDREHLENRKQ